MNFNDPFLQMLALFLFFLVAIGLTTIFTDHESKD